MHSKNKNVIWLRRGTRALAAVVALSAPLLAGCSTHIGDMATPIALPAGAPERPATPYTYPAVHDMPPDRSAPMMSDEQQTKMEADLVATRNRQQGTPPAKKPVAKKPANETSAEAPGGTRNP